MELKVLKCPECGASFQEDKKVSFCSHCGAKLYLNDDTKNIVYKTENIAKIKEIEANKEIKLKQMKDRTRFTENKWILNFISFYIFFFMILGALCIYTNNKRTLEKEFWICVKSYIAFYIILYLSLYIQSRLQEKQLQKMLNGIYIDMKSCNYEIALIKAKSLYYTAKWSNDIKEKWEDTRESVIKIIEEKMKHKGE